MVTERAGRISLRAIDDAFARRQQGGRAARRAGPALPAAPYITHLVEFDYPERFVSEQAGHRYASTTAIYR